MPCVTADIGELPIDVLADWSNSMVCRIKPATSFGEADEAVDIWPETVRPLIITQPRTPGTAREKFKMTSSYPP
jgi:hypothetical protein